MICKASTQTCFLKVLLLTLVITCAVSGQTPEQPAETGKTPSSAAHRPPRSTMDDRIKVLARTLDLSAAQQAQVKTILEQGRQQMIQNRLNTSISGSARIDQFRALQDQTIERIRAILTGEQKRKYDLLAARKLQQQATPPDVDAWLDATRPQQTN